MLHVAMLHMLLHSFTNEEQSNFSAMNPATVNNLDESMIKPDGSCIVLSQINTLHCQWKELEDIGGQR